MPREGAFRRIVGVVAVLGACLGFAALPANSIAAPPANDEFANSQVIASAPATVAGNVLDSTLQTGEPAAGFGASFDGSVWYAWTAPANGVVQISVTGGLAVGAYTGAAHDALTPKSQNYNSITFAATASQTYRISVAVNPDSETEAFTLNLVFDPESSGGANNDFANADLILGESVDVSGTLAGATFEAGEPAAAYSSQLSGTVWYYWTAPRSGEITLTSDKSVAFGAYSGTAVNALTTRGQGFQPVRFFANKDETYRIAVGRPSSNTVSTFVLRLRYAPPPPNDLFANAKVLTGSDATDDATTKGALREFGEPNHFSQGGDASIWYRWQAPSSTTMVLDTCHGTGEYFLAAVGIYTGSSVDSLTKVAAGYCWTAFQATAGVTYRIAVDSHPAQYMERFHLSLRQADKPANDDFASATLLSGAAPSGTGTLIDSSTEANEPNHRSANTTSSVWFTWTPPTSGPASVTVDGSPQESVARIVAVYQGSSLGGLTPVAAGDFGAFFTADQGVTYRVAVASANRTPAGSFNIEAGVFVPPANDDFANAQNLAGATVSASGDNRGATMEIGEPDQIGTETRGSVWFNWTASQSGPVFIDACGKSRVVESVAAYTGNSVDGLSPVASGTCEISFEAVAATTYRVAVSNRFAKAASFTLRIRPGGAPANDNFANAQVLNGATPTAAGELAGGSLEPAEPLEIKYPGYVNSSVWYRWIAPTSGIIELNLGRQDAAIAVYTGNQIDSLTVAGESDFGFGDHRFTTTAGTEYMIMIGKWQPTISGFSLEFSNPDVTPPDTFIDSGPSGWHTSRQATFTFHGTPGDTAKILCRLDENQPLPCSGSVTYANLSEGYHYVTITAEDAAGNSDPSPIGIQLDIDVTAPVVKFVSGPSGTTNSSTANFRFGADSTSTYMECRLDGGSFQPCEWVHSISSLTPGTHTLELRGVDFAGNQSVVISRTWTYSPAATTTTTAGTVEPGETISTDPVGTGPTETQVATASILVPQGGEVSVVQQPVSTPEPSGYAVVGQQFEITAPDATVEEPLVLTFQVHHSALPEEFELDDVTIMRNGTLAADCTSTDGSATPDPCVLTRWKVGAGDVNLKVLTSHASTWNVALPADEIVPPDPKCEAAKSKLTIVKKTLTKARSQVSAAGRQVAKMAKALKKAKKTRKAAKIKKAKRALARAKSNLNGKKKASGKAQSAVTSAAAAVKKAC